MNQPKYAITKQFHGTFEEAVASITNSLKSEGFGILTQINVAETLQKKLGVEYPNYMILGACNPPNAFKALQAEKEIGLLLPCNIIVYEESDTVFIAIMKPTVALVLSDNPAIMEIAQKVEATLIHALENSVEQKRNK